MKDVNDDRAWSDDQGFLFQVGVLISKCHEASMDPDQDVYDWFWLLENLQLEIVGQLVVRNMISEKTELDNMRKSIKTNLKIAYNKVGNNVGNLNQNDAGILRDIVFPYHEKLTILIHKMDLRLHEVKKKEMSASWSDS